MVAYSNQSLYRYSSLLWSSTQTKVCIDIRLCYGLLLRPKFVSIFVFAMVSYSNQSLYRYLVFGMVAYSNQSLYRYSFLLWSPTQTKVCIDIRLCYGLLLQPKFVSIFGLCYGRLLKPKFVSIFVFAMVFYSNQSLYRYSSLLWSPTQTKVCIDIRLCYGLLLKPKFVSIFGLCYGRLLKPKFVSIFVFAMVSYSNQSLYRYSSLLWSPTQTKVCIDIRLCYGLLLKPKIFSIISQPACAGK